MEDSEENIENKQANKQKKKFKRKMILMLMKALVPILIIVLLASFVFTIFSVVRDKMIELASNIKTTVVSFWKWLTDDYWIKLDKEVEFEETDPDTRTTYYC